MSNNPLHIGPDLRNALVAMVRKRVPESEVDDVVQQTLADAFASPHAPQDAESFRRWIFGVAKNKVVDYHRRAGRETFDVPEIAGNAAPHQEADLLRWAEKHLPPGEENKATLEWMLREGDGEKLESIAETEHVPAPRVRQRVSRLRRHLKAHWAKEVAVLAALGVLITGIVLFLRRAPTTPEIANEDVARAEQLRKGAYEKCLAQDWNDCVQKLDEAKKLDAAGDSQPAVQQARQNAAKARSLPPTPPSATQLNNINPPPIESAPTPSPMPTGSGSFNPKFDSDSMDAKTAPVKGPQKPSPKSAKPQSTESSPSPPMAPSPAPAPAPKSVTPSKMQGKKSSVSDSLGGPGFGSNNIGKTGVKFPDTVIPSRKPDLSESKSSDKPEASPSKVEPASSASSASKK